MHARQSKHTEHSVGNIMLELKASQRNEASIGNFISKRLWQIVRLNDTCLNQLVDASSLIYEGKEQI